MKEIIKSKGIISFLIFITGIAFVSTNSMNSMEDSNDISANLVVMNENV